MIIIHLQNIILIHNSVFIFPCRVVSKCIVSECIFVSLRACICEFVCVYGYLVCIYECVHYIYTFVNTYIHTYIYINIYTYMHTKREGQTGRAVPNPIVHNISKSFCFFAWSF